MPILRRRYRIMGRWGIVLTASVVATLIVGELTARLAYGVQERHREADAVFPDMPAGNLA